MAETGGEVNEVFVVRGIGQNPASSLVVGSCEMLSAKQASHDCASGAEGRSEDVDGKQLARAIVCSEKLDG